MDGLEFEFKVLSICGIWMPLRWSDSKKLKFCYKMYSILTAGSFVAVIILQSLIYVTSEISFQHFTRLLFTSVTTVSMLVKTTTFLLRRNGIIHLMDLLTDNLCLPTDSEELEIQRGIYALTRKWTIFSNVIAQAALFMFFMVPLAQGEKERTLPFEIWIPYDLCEGSNYWITYSLEIFPLSVAVFVNATVTVIVNRFEVQAYTQFDYIKHRIHRLCNVVEHSVCSKSTDGKNLDHYEHKILTQSVDHHIQIIKFFKTFSRTFESIFLQVYFGSILIISAIVYEISTHSSSLVDKIRSFVYLFSMTLEICMYCWFANELTMKSSNLGMDISNTTNWMVLSKKSRKILQFMTFHATMHPVKLVFRGIMSLNLDAFKSILRVAYSTFNILKKSS